MLFQNIVYFIRKNITLYRHTIVHLARCLALIGIIALALEVFVFNFNYFATAHLNTINLKKDIKLNKDSNDEFRLTSLDHEMEFSNLDTVVKNIRIDFDHAQPAQNLTIKILFTDDAHLTYFDSTEYTEGIPEVKVATNSTQSEYINLNATGAINNLKISIVGDDVSYPIKLHTVYLNAHHPFSFSTLRFSLTCGVLLLIFMFRPRSAIYRIRIVEERRQAKAGIIAAVVIECALVSTFLFYGSNLVGVATAQYNYGEWDGHSLVNVYQVGGENANQYAELAKSMAQGKFYLEDDAPEWLKNMSDPYDKGARDQAQKESGEDYLFDVAYYDGHYYVYFGVVPVLLFYLPFYLLTGANFPTAIGVLIAALAFVLGISALLHRFALYHFKRVSLGLYLLLQISVVSCCGLSYLLKFPTFYSLPITCGLAFSVWGLYFWLCGRQAEHRSLFFVAGSLCMALVVGCRPQLLFLSFLAFPLFWRPYITEKRLFSKKGVRDLVCLLAPYVVVAILIMLYNYARFNSFFDFGANYNLTVNDMTKRGWNVGRIAPAAFAYFIQLPNICGIFPFLQPVDFATTYMGQTIKEATYGGIFACYPILWIIFFMRPIIALRNSERSSRTITGVISVLLVSGVLVAILDAEMAGILQRYYADFSFMFLSAVVLLVFIVNENIPDTTPAPPARRHRFKTLLKEGPRAYLQKRQKSTASSTTLALPRTRPLLLKTLIALCTVSILYNALLCCVPEIGWYSDMYPWAYQDVLETFLFWT